MPVLHLFQADVADYAASSAPMAIQGTPGAIQAGHNIVNGTGIGQTLASLAARLFESGVLVPILEKHTCATMPISVIYPSNKQLNAPVRVFVDWIVERLAE